MDLEKEKKNLESLYSWKESEAYLTKKDIDKVQFEHAQLKNDNLNLNKELEALKNHTNVLES